MKKYLISCLVVLFMVFTSCSNDYRNAIPASSIALVSIDATDKDLGERLNIITDFFHLHNPTDCGIDFREKTYFFETADGNLGLCVKVSDDQKLRETFKKLEKEGIAKEESERQKCNFFTLSDKFVAGYTSDALVCLGPVVAAAKGEAINTIARYLNQKEDDGIVGTPMLDKLDSITSPVAIVAQASALPQNLSSVLTLGMPKDTDPSKCIIAASINIKKENIHIEGQPMSFNPQTNKAIQNAYSSLRPIGNKYLQSYNSKSFLGIFLNVKGEAFLPLLQSSTTLQTFLAGINSAIDLNAIIKSIDGNVLLSAPSYVNNNLSISLAAELSKSDFLSDVAYWKSSVLKGSQITDWQKNAFCYSGQGMTFYFGVTDGKDKEFFSGSSQTEATMSIQQATSQLDKDEASLIVGKRIAVIIGVSSLLPEGAGMASMMLPQKLKIKNVVYTVK